MRNIAINRAHFPVSVLGPGQRIGIWFQGCSLHCKACVSQDTWETDPARKMPIAQLLAWCRHITEGHFDGVTLSGGEPFDQPKALSELLSGLVQWRKSSGLDFDILCYSGYPYSRLQKRHAPLLRKLDALIPEPYIDVKPLAHLWRGSSNQPLLPLSDRGHKKYAEYLDAPVESCAKRIQTLVDGQRIWYVGIPGRGDMTALGTACQASGIEFNQVSWMP